MAEEREAKKEIALKKFLLIINAIVLAIGLCGGPLLLRLYFVHGGSRVWLSSFLQTAGFPFMFPLLIISFIIRRRRFYSPASPNTTTDEEPKLFHMKLPLFLASSFVGLLLGVDDYLYSYGAGRLPVSTSSLLVATQLAFTAIFAFFMVKQKFTAYTVNAVFLLSLGSGVLAMHASGDRPEGESNKEYVMGFVMTSLAAALYGFILPLLELVYKKTRQTITFSLVLEIQLVMCLVATIFCLVGMAIKNDFKAIPREARNFDLGETTYYVVLVASALLWQLGFIGSLGVIYCSSSLLSGILTATCVPITEVLAVISFKESFKAEKGVSLVLALWGFVSYFYGDYKQVKKIKSERTAEIDLPQNHSVLDP